MIKRLLLLFILLNFLGIQSSFANSQLRIEPLPQHRISTLLITRFVDRYHYIHVPLNDQFSKKVFDEYLKTLDPNRNVFTQTDIDSFSKYKTELDDDLRRGDVTPAYVIYQRYTDEREQRAEFSLKRLKEPFNFTVKEDLDIDRDHASWPANSKAADDLWRKQVKNDILTLRLSGKSEKEIQKTLRKRYEQIKTRLTQIKSEDIYETFINAYLRSIDPHTAYFSPRTSENFDINMRLSLEGIGAVLQSKDEYTVVRSVVKGGPAELSHQLHSGDRIVGVGQGKKEIEDVVGWRLDDVVDKIRGPKGSVVKLSILPKDTGEGGVRKTVTLVRNKIKLEDQQVKKSVIDVPDGKKERKIGVIEIPTFYVDFAAMARGDKDYRSTTRDTLQLIKQLEADNVDGIVIDLRGNGGGSLAEAISLTGLFIKQGPVVQIKENNGEIKVDEDEDPSVAYSGPLAVLVDYSSASASEIFSGAIQDYHRGVVIGTRTFGKGTVQSIVDLNNYVKGGNGKLGKLKITMAQFFRVDGASTQHRGVVPDILYPTVIDSKEFGERSLENALPFAQVSPAHYSPSYRSLANLNSIRTEHEARIKKSIGFKFLLQQEELRKEAIETKELSLVEKDRKKELEKREEQRHVALNKFRKSIGLKTVSLAEDDKEEDTSDDNKKLADALRMVELKEAGSILIDLSHKPEQQAVTQEDSKTVGHPL